MVDHDEPSSDLENTLACPHCGRRFGIRRTTLDSEERDEVFVEGILGGMDPSFGRAYVGSPSSAHAAPLSSLTAGYHYHPLRPCSVLALQATRSAAAGRREEWEAPCDAPFFHTSAASWPAVRLDCDRRCWEDTSPWGPAIDIDLQLLQHQQQQRKEKKREKDLSERRAAATPATSGDAAAVEKQIVKGYQDVHALMDELTRIEVPLVCKSCWGSHVQPALARKVKEAAATEQQMDGSDTADDFAIMMGSGPKGMKVAAADDEEAELWAQVRASEKEEEELLRQIRAAEERRDAEDREGAVAVEAAPREEAVTPSEGQGTCQHQPPDDGDDHQCTPSSVEAIDLLTDIVTRSDVFHCSSAAGSKHSHLIGMGWLSQPPTTNATDTFHQCRYSLINGVRLGVSSDAALSSSPAAAHSRQPLPPSCVPFFDVVRLLRLRYGAYTHNKLLPPSPSLLGLLMGKAAAAPHTRLPRLERNAALGYVLHLVHLLRCQYRCPPVRWQQQQPDGSCQSYEVQLDPRGAQSEIILMPTAPLPTQSPSSLGPVASSWLPPVWWRATRSAEGEGGEEGHHQQQQHSRRVANSHQSVLGSSRRLMFYVGDSLHSALLQQSELGEACVLVAVCAHQLLTVVQQHIVASADLPDPPSPPHRIQPSGAVGGFSLRYGAVRDEVWSHGMALLLEDLQWVLRIR